MVTGAASVGALWRSMTVRADVRLPLMMLLGYSEKSDWEEPGSETSNGTVFTDFPGLALIGTKAYGAVRMGHWACAQERRVREELEPAIIYLRTSTTVGALLAWPA